MPTISDDDTDFRAELRVSMQQRAIEMGTAHFSKQERASLVSLYALDYDILTHGGIEFRILEVKDTPTASYKYPLHMKVQRLAADGQAYGPIMRFIPHVRNLTGLQSALECHMQKYRTYLRDAKLPCTSDAALIGTIITVTRATPHSDLFKYRLQWTLPAVHVQGWAGFKFHVRQVYAHWSAKLSDLVNKLR